MTAAAASPAVAGFEFSPVAGSPAQSPKAEIAGTGCRHDIRCLHQLFARRQGYRRCDLRNPEQAGIRCWIAPRDIMPGDEWAPPSSRRSTSAAPWC